MRQRTATVVFNFNSTQTDTSTKDTEEKDFRERYTLELRKKRQCGYKQLLWS